MMMTKSQQGQESPSGAEARFIFGALSARVELAPFPICAWPRLQHGVGCGRASLRIGGADECVRPYTELLLERELDLAQQEVLTMKRSFCARRHAESGVLVIRLELHITSEIPVEANSRFSGEAGRA